MRTNQARQNEESHLPADSLYEEVMNDPDARHAYFHTTKGVLTGRAEDEDTIAIKALLDEQWIAYLYNPDFMRPRPIFLTKTAQIVGRAAIEAHIENLVEHREQGTGPYAPRESANV